MLKVISNTTPLISLLKIGKLSLLHEIYGEIIVPNGVFDELEDGKSKPYYQNISKLDWIKISSISNRDSFTYFFDLDKGEAEVLILAHEMNADLVLIDEIMARRYAKILQLNLSGTIGVLLKAKEKKIIPSVKDLIMELVSKGTWFDKTIINKALEMAKE
jgi:uncharacterized protein